MLRHGRLGTRFERASAGGAAEGTRGSGGAGAKEGEGRGAIGIREGAERAGGYREREVRGEMGIKSHLVFLSCAHQKPYSLARLLSPFLSE